MKSRASRKSRGSDRRPRTCGPSESPAVCCPHRGSFDPAGKVDWSSATCCRGFAIVPTTCVSSKRHSHQRRKNGVVITSRFGFRHWLVRSQECVLRMLSDWEDRLRFGPKGRDSKAQGNALGMRGTTNAKPQQGGTRVSPRWGFGAIGLREPQGCRPGLSSAGPLGHCNHVTPNSHQRMKASRELIAAPFLSKPWEFGSATRRGPDVQIES